MYVCMYYLFCGKAKVDLKKNICFHIFKVQQQFISVKFQKVSVTQFVEREEGGGNRRTFKEFNNTNKQTQK